MTATPSQTAGPFVSIGTDWMAGGGPGDRPAGHPGASAGTVELTGVVRDGLGEPVTDAMLELWQPVPGAGHFRRALTGPDGGYGFVVPKPSPVPSLAPGGQASAPHADVSIFARGLLQRLVTRVYFADEAEANASDPLLCALPPELLPRLVAAVAGPGRYRFDLHLQGEMESVFFEPW